MNNITFVCPLDLKIISKLKDRKIVLMSSDDVETSISFLDSIVKTNPLECLWIKSKNAITDILPTKNWQKYPIRYDAKSFGNKETFLTEFESFIPLNIRFFLPCNSENLTSLQFLTSLGFHTGIIFSEINWEKLVDLFYYCQYTKIGNGTVEPFNFINKDYKQRQDFNKYSDFGEIYFSDSPKYIHINEIGDLFITDILGNEIFLNENIDNLFKLSNNEIFTNLSQTWKKHFLGNTECSKCSAWRICLGKFDQEKHYPNCKEFFTTIIEA